MNTDFLSGFILSVFHCVFHICACTKYTMIENVRVTVTDTMFRNRKVHERCLWLHFSERS